MTLRQRRYPKEEFARRGTEIYERDVRPHVEADSKGKYVAIDIETGAWEMDASEIAAGDGLRARIPDAQTWMVRVGYGHIRRFGAGRVRTDTPCSAGCFVNLYVGAHRPELGQTGLIVRG